MSYSLRSSLLLQTWIGHLVDDVITATVTRLGLRLRTTTGLTPLRTKTSLVSKRTTTGLTPLRTVASLVSKRTMEKL